MEVAQLGSDRYSVNGNIGRTERLAAGPAWQDLDLVFCTQLGGPLDPRNINREWEGEPDDPAGRWITHVRLHDLRHSCASFLLAQGVSARVVMEILEHSGIAITMNTYAHVLPTLLGSALDGMDRLLGDDDEIDDETSG